MDQSEGSCSPENCSSINFVQIISVIMDTDPDLFTTEPPSESTSIEQGRF